MAEGLKQETTRLRLRVSAAAEARLRGGHPWLFAESIREQNRPGAAGELAIIYDRHDRFLAVGLFDPDSPIRVRILHLGKPQAIEASWWARRLQAALERRRGIFDEQTTGYRCLHGESDGWPGLVLDRYGSTLVLKVYTAAWLPRLADLARLLREHAFPLLLGPQPRGGSARGEDRATPQAQARLVLRLSRNLQALAHKRFARMDGQILFGPPLTGPVAFLETGLHFEADVLRGQKTGFFLDQRENRRRVEALAAGRRALNAFSFSGGFSVYAARGRAAAVTDLDISRHALESAERNFGLNQANPLISACAHESIQADAFEWLAGHPRRVFELVVLDPPSLAKRETERLGAIRAYGRLVSLALGHLAGGGILVACSCSAHVSGDEFFGAVQQALARAGRRFEELERAQHPPDHLATFSEAEYLKAIYLKVAR